MTSVPGLTVSLVSLVHGIVFYAFLIIGFLPFVTSKASPDGNTTDYLALLSFKSFISDDPSGKLNGWNENISFCQWPGITCDSPQNPGRVTSLNLKASSLSGRLSPSLVNLTFLSRLDLAENLLNGNIPSDLGGLQRLTFLNLSQNSFGGQIPASLGMCLELEIISLRNNKLQGTIPSNISRCSNLQQLSLGDNMLVGQIPNELGLLSKLIALSLSSNSISGPIPSSFGNLSSLVILVLSNNNLEGSIPLELGRIMRLERLDLFSNKLSGSIPVALFNYSFLKEFSVGSNNLSGSLPIDFGRNLPGLQNLYLNSNLFHGPIPLFLSNASELQLLQVTNNSFSGLVPSNLGMLSTLSSLRLGANKLEAKEAADWGFFTSLTNCSFLDELDLSDNKFGGMLPKSVANLSSSLRKFSFRINSIHGTIPDGIANLRNLEVFSVNMNMLSGTIPEAVGMLPRLGLFSASKNNLSGSLPDSLGNLTSLSELYLSHNKLNGSIPERLGNLQNLNLLDLSYNDFTGAIPKQVLGLSSLSLFLNMSNNFLSGALPQEVGSLKNLRALDVSHNQLSGNIPSALGNCRVLEYLQMESNNFEGTIPQSLSSLTGVQLFNISHNNLSGTIPVFFESLSALQFLDMSFNDLEGEVPRGGVFNNVSHISVVGNKRICGGISGLHLPACPTTNREARRGHIILIAGLVVAAAIFLFFATFYCFYKQFWQKRNKVLGKISWKHSHMNLSYSELFEATDGFSAGNLIGVGSFGSVYKGVMPKERKPVAVKVLNCNQPGASSSFMAECMVLRNIRHRNLLRVLTACSSMDSYGNDFKALVFEYMHNGSLESWLHSHPNDRSNARKLSLGQRIDVAFDVAVALEYLHQQSQTPVVHCDLKPSNILLDDSMTAHVGDFGLARFLPRDTSLISGANNSSTVKGTFGYIPPEYGMGGPISIEGDIYSFGITLLEMFTGKGPTDEAFVDDLTLRSYAENSYPEKIRDMVDPQLQMEDENGAICKCLTRLIGIGLACSKESPRERLPIREVLIHLHEIKQVLTHKRRSNKW